VDASLLRILVLDLLVLAMLFEDGVVEIPTVEVVSAVLEVESGTVPVLTTLEVEDIV